MSAMTVSIDLNADLGEGDPHDAELLEVVSSCNIACGGHAGDVSTMAATVAKAIECKVAVGAHPAYPDRDGFGRRRLFLTDASLQEILADQIDSLRSVADAHGAAITHVKPHGALYNDAASDADLAALVAGAIVERAPNAALVGLPNSELQRAALSAGLRFVGEAFIDRAYRDDGRLVPRGEPGAVHSTLEQVLNQAISLARNRNILAENGHVVDVAAETLCIHGDTPGAAEKARTVRRALERQGVEIRAVCR